MFWILFQPQKGVSAKFSIHFRLTGKPKKSYKQSESNNASILCYSYRIMNVVPAASKNRREN